MSGSLSHILAFRGLDWLESRHYMLNNCHSNPNYCNQTWCHSTYGPCHCTTHIPLLYVEFSPPGSVRCPLLGQFVMLGWAREQGSSDWSQSDEQGWPDWSWALVSWALMGVWVTFIICPWWAVIHWGGVPCEIFKPSSLHHKRFPEAHIHMYVHYTGWSATWTHGY